MMGLIINISMCRFGGGHQVAVSLLNSINLYPEFDYILINENLLEYSHQIPKNKCVVISSVFQLNKFLFLHKDKVLFNLFSPAWSFFYGRQISGFARPHLIYPLGDYWSILSVWEQFLIKVKLVLQNFYFKQLPGPLICETVDSAVRVRNIWGKDTLVINNEINAVHRDKRIPPKQDISEKGDSIVIALIGHPYRHKNFEIVSDILKHISPVRNIEVICTFANSDYLGSFDDRFIFLGRVSVEELYKVYEKADIILLPTFLECFSATWIEAMWFNRPLVTSNIPSAKSVCKDAALYANPMDAQEFGKRINSIIHNDGVRNNLIRNGRVVVKEYLGNRNAKYAEKLSKMT